MLKWTSEPLSNAVLVRECFHLLHRQYSLLHEVREALSVTCIVKESMEISALCSVRILFSIRLSLIYTQGNGRYSTLIAMRDWWWRAFYTSRAFEICFDFPSSIRWTWFQYFRGYFLMAYTSLDVFRTIGVHTVRHHLIDTFFAVVDTFRSL